MGLLHVHGYGYKTCLFDLTIFTMTSEIVRIMTFYHIEDHLRRLKIRAAENRTDEFFSLRKQRSQI